MPGQRLIPFKEKSCRSPGLVVVDVCLRVQRPKSRQHSRAYPRARFIFNTRSICWLSCWKPEVVHCRTYSSKCATTVENMYQGKKNHFEAARQNRMEGNRVTSVSEQNIAVAVECTWLAAIVSAHATSQLGCCYAVRCGVQSSVNSDDSCRADIIRQYTRNRHYSLSIFLILSVCIIYVKRFQRRNNRQPAPPNRPHWWTTTTIQVHSIYIFYHGTLEQ